MSATDGNWRAGATIPRGAAAASMLLLVGCTEEVGVGVGAGLGIDLEYVPALDLGPEGRDRHPARFVCGEIGPTQDQTAPVNDPLVGAVYRTLINVTNVGPGQTCMDIGIIPTILEDDIFTPPLFTVGCLQPDEQFLQGVEFDCRWIRETLAGFGHPTAGDDFLTGTLLVQLQGEPQEVRVSTIITTLHKQAHGGLADLEPVAKNEEGPPYCNFDEQDRLIVTVRNNGTGLANESMTEVEFPTMTTERETPEIGFNSEVDLEPIDLPSLPLTESSIEFVIRVNSGGDVDESDEDNNVMQASCANPFL